MSNHQYPEMTAETITKYDVLFALRTGVTVLVQRVAAFNGAKEPTFAPAPDDSGDVVITAGDKTVILKKFRKEHLDAAVSRGFILFYEMEDEDVVRCTHCSYKKQA